MLIEVGPRRKYVTPTEYASTVVEARLKGLLADPKQPPSVKSAVTQLILSGAIKFPDLEFDRHHYLFAVGEPVLHSKSGGEYVIVGLPCDNRLEATNEPCYSYVGKDGLTWHRSRVEMEDGRFVSAYKRNPYFQQAVSELAHGAS